MSRLRRGKRTVVELGGKRPALPRRLLQTPGTLKEGFEAAADWSLSSGTAANDTTNFLSGTQSVKLTSASGTNGLMTKTTNFVASPNVRMDYYLYDAVADQAGIILYLSTTTNFSKYFSVAFNPAHQGWNTVNLIAADWTNTGSAVWTDPIVRVRVKINAAADKTPAASFDNLRTDEVQRPAVLIVFDDGFDSAYTQALTILRAAEMEATAYIITDSLDTAGYVTSAQLAEIAAAGWHVANHTSDHTDLTTLSQADMQTKITDAQTALDTLLGTSSDHLHVAYPFGAFDDTVLAAMAAVGALTGRRVGNNDITTPYSNWYRIPIRNIANTTTLAAAQAFVDSAISRKEVTLLLFHALVETPSLSTHWAISDFQSLVTYIASKRGQIEVLRVKDLYNVHSGPVKRIW